MEQRFQLLSLTFLTEGERARCHKGKGMETNITQELLKSQGDKPDSEALKYE